MSKTIEQQVEELKSTVHCLFDSTKTLDEVAEEIKQALQERDRIAREEERERIRDAYMERITRGISAERAVEIALTQPNHDQ